MSLKFHPQVMMRTPSLPFSNNIDEHLLETLFEDSFFLTAIYNASPVLYDEIEKYKAGLITQIKDVQKIKNSVFRYYVRMSTRATPFGLFANGSLATWGNKTEIRLNLNKKVFSRFDMNFLGQLVTDLVALDEIKLQLKYKLNNSIYRVSNEWRYIEYFYKNNRRIHQISSIEHAPILEVLTEEERELSFDEIVAIIVNQDYEFEEAKAFVLALIKCQFLISELDVNITGEDYLENIIKTITNLPVKSSEINIKLEALHQLAKLINTHTTSGNFNIKFINEIERIAESTDSAFDKSKLIQIDSFINSENAVLSLTIQEDLKKAFEKLLTITGPYENDLLSTFKSNFQSRYEERFMPLLEVLDPNIGIGFGFVNSNEDDVYVNNIKINNSNKEALQTLHWSSLDAELLKCYQLCIADNFKALDLNLILPDKKVETTNLAPSFAAFFTVLNNDSILIESFSGSSSLHLLGRFSCGNKEIENLCLNIAEHEQNTNEEIVFAEIIHLPENRTGNILMHKSFRAFEMGYLAKTTNPEINLKTVLVGIINNEIILVDKASKKRIIPRLSNAHNYSSFSLPVYNFLCSLQAQNINCGANFSWGSLATLFNKFPRVVFNNIIIKEAEWIITKIDIDLFLKTNFNTQNYNDLILKLGLPSIVNIADGDNELLINFENECSYNLFLSMVKNRHRVVLKENLNTGCNEITDQSKQYYANQFVATILNEEPSYAKMEIDEQHFDPKYQAIDSNWLYLKINVKEESQAIILKNIIQPYIVHLKLNNLLAKWFFIKYKDNESHLRLRILPKVEITKGQIFEIWEQYLLNSSYKHLAPFYNTAIYKQEFARYGFAAMDNIESVFSLDSDLQLEFLNESLDIPKWNLAFYILNFYLNIAQYSLEEKIDFTERNLKLFEKEFNADKQIRNALSKKYNEIRTDFIDLQKKESAIDSILKNYEDSFINLFQSIGYDTIKNVLPSLLHMSFNRLYNKEQRLQEYFSYDLGVKYYKNIYFMSKNKSESIKDKNLKANTIV